jgi:exopolysaccharide biosynthesis polyprenyl glycosylphosphotransferase
MYPVGTTNPTSTAKDGRPGAPHFPLRSSPAGATRSKAAAASGGLAVKRLLDVVVSGAALIVLALPILIIAVLVKLTSPGPAFYRQERVGKNGRTFHLLKFRSMHVDAESATGPVWARQDDPRRTAFGCWLRQTSIDELPQLWNILRGEMSLVGPRPERPHFVEQFTGEMSEYPLRHAVRPGLTGWAQIHGLRGDTSIKSRLDYDLYYVRNRTLRMDLAILAMTPWVVLGDPNAY